MVYRLTLTETHLSKSTLNGAALADAIGDALGFAFEQIGQGEKRTFPAIFDADGGATELRFYKPQSKPERRFSIARLTSRAKAGDVLAVWFEADAPEPERIRVAIETP